MRPAHRATNAALGLIAYDTAHDDTCRPRQASSERDLCKVRLGCASCLVRIAQLDRNPLQLPKPYTCDFRLLRRRQLDGESGKRSARLNPGLRIFRGPQVADQCWRMRPQTSRVPTLHMRATPSVRRSDTYRLSAVGVLDERVRVATASANLYYKNWRRAIVRDHEGVRATVAKLMGSDDHLRVALGAVCFRVLCCCRGHGLGGRQHRERRQPGNGASGHSFLPSAAKFEMGWVTGYRAGQTTTPS